jgi:hypothetical protein
MNKVCSLIKKEQQKQEEKRFQHFLFVQQLSLTIFQDHMQQKHFEIQKKRRRLKLLMLKYKKYLAKKRKHQKHKKHQNHADVSLTRFSMFANLNSDNPCHTPKLSYT